MNCCKPHECLIPAENAKNSAEETISQRSTCNHMITKTVVPDILLIGRLV